MPTSGSKPVTHMTMSEPHAPPPLTETIIVVGSEMHYDSFWFKMMFMAAALRTARHSHSTRITIAYVDVGYTKFEKLPLEALKRERDVNILTLASPYDLVSYVNNRELRHKGAVATFLIQEMYFFSHGYPTEFFGSGVIDLNYHISAVVPHFEEILLDEGTFEQMLSTSFTNSASIYSYACRTGNSVSKDGPFDKDEDCKPQKSLAQKMADHLQVKVYAFLTRSYYGEVLRDKGDSDRISHAVKEARKTRDGKVIEIPPDHQALPHPGLDGTFPQEVSNFFGHASGPCKDGADEYALWRKRGAISMPVSDDTPKGLTPGLWLFEAKKPPTPPKPKPTA